MLEVWMIMEGSQFLLCPVYLLPVILSPCSVSFLPLHTSLSGPLSLPIPSLPTSPSPIHDSPSRLHPSTLRQVGRAWHCPGSGAPSVPATNCLTDVCTLCWVTGSMLMTKRRGEWEWRCRGHSLWRCSTVLRWTKGVLSPPLRIDASERTSREH